MKRTLFINHSTETFGAETVLLQLLERCYPSGSNSVFIVEPKNNKPSTFRKALLNLGHHNIISLPYKNLGGTRLRSYIVLIYNIYAVLRLWFYVKKNKIDIIYSNTSITCLGIQLARCTKLPHIWHIHESTNTCHTWSPSLSKLLQKMMSYNKNKIIFISQTQQKQWCQELQQIENSQVIYNPIKKNHVLKEFQEQKKIVFGYLGSRAFNKNVSMLIEVFTELYVQYSNISLILSKNVGEDNLVVNRKIKEFNLSNVVTEESALSPSAVADFFNKIDVLVLPSFSESWGMVVLEAMQVGVATIVTNQTGLHELLTDKKETLFIDPYNKQSLLQAMKKTLDPQVRKELVQNAKNLLCEKKFNEQFEEKMKDLLF
ncbi:MAG: glycosyltransferase family 4 protein [Bacteroidales bacterium]